MGLPERAATASLADVVDRILDKGLVINADITVSVVGVELLGIKIRAAVASFETAAAYGLEFPSGTRLPAVAAQGTGTLGQDGDGQKPSLSADEGTVPEHQPDGHQRRSRVS